MGKIIFWRKFPPIKFRLKYLEIKGSEVHHLGRREVKHREDQLQSKSNKSTSSKRKVSGITEERCSAVSSSKS